MVRRYLTREEEHPRNRTFEEAYWEVLARSGIQIYERFPSWSARPSTAGWSGRHWFQGFAKNAHPWLISFRPAAAEFVTVFMNLSPRFLPLPERTFGALLPPH